jgi:pimeloyl-ACP methyl ester carboxylesterase
VFDVLAYLLQHHDRVVSKDELIGHIWPDRFISDAALSSRLMAARKAIGDSGSEQRLIRTIHGRGFRFVGTPALIESAETPPSAGPSAPMPAFEQDIQFCTAADGTRIAFATAGQGPPLVKAANWLTHLDFDATSPVWAHIWRDLASDHYLVRYDGRGNGLSDRELGTYTFDSWVDDLEAVVDALGLERFPLIGISQGGAIAVTYAARHPDKVSALLLLGAYGRGRLKRDPVSRDQSAATRTLMRLYWGKQDAVFREMFSITMIPDGTETQRDWLTDLQRESASPENALLFHDTSAHIDVEHLLPGLRVPTLVLHARHDQRVPFEEGRRMAGLIPNAHFVSLESRNHLLLEHEPAWHRARTEIRQFLARVE